MENKTPIILAVAGKGGVGKTSVAANMVRCLVQAHPDKKILAIDADPAVGLSTALGIEVKTTIDDIRRQVIETVEDGQSRAAIELLSEARYLIFDALVETDGFSFIAVGRPEAAGCYCKINSYLKEVISILSENFDYVVIDGEAGIEQINRRVMEQVTHLILVTDSSKKGCHVIQTIREVADHLVMAQEIGVIANRLPVDNGEIPEAVKEAIEAVNMKVLAYIPADHNLAEFDLRGDNVFYLPQDSAIVQGVEQALRNINVLQEKV